MIGLLAVAAAAQGVIFPASTDSAEVMAFYRWTIGLNGPKSSAACPGALGPAYSSSATMDFQVMGNTGFLGYGYASDGSKEPDNAVCVIFKYTVDPSPGLINVEYCAANGLWRGSFAPF